MSPRARHGARCGQAETGALIHDAARPLVTRRIIAGCAAALRGHDAFGAAVPASRSGPPATAAPSFAASRIFRSASFPAARPAPRSPTRPAWQQRKPSWACASPPSAITSHQGPRHVGFWFALDL